MPAPNVDFYDLTTTTLRQYSSAVADNMSQHNALYRILKDKKLIRDVPGGTTITENLDYSENQTVQNYRGYDVLNISPQQVLTVAEYMWRQKSVAITYSGLEKRVNSGSKSKIIDLVKARINNAIKSASNDMNRALYSMGIAEDGSADIGGFQLVIADDPTNTVGGISGQDWRFWRNKVWKSGTSEGTPVTLDEKNILRYMNRMWISLIRGTDKPDFILTSPDMYNMFKESLQAQMRYSDAKMASAGYETLKYESANVYFDQTVSENGLAIMPEKHMYFINTDYLRLAEHPDAKWTQAEDRVSVNQDATVIPLLWMGQLTCNARFVHGVMIDDAA